jgi:hypothetical protein
MTQPKLFFKSHVNMFKTLEKYSVTGLQKTLYSLTLVGELLEPAVNERNH